MCVSVIDLIIKSVYECNRFNNIECVWVNRFNNIEWPIKIMKLYEAHCTYISPSIIKLYCVYTVLVFFGYLIS